MRTTPLISALLFCSTLSASDCIINPNPSYNNPVCTAANGSIGLNPVNGSAPYHYKWSTGDTTSSIAKLSQGTYTVRVTDKNGCTVSQAFSLISTSRIIRLNATAFSDTCAMARGKAIVTVSGNGSAPYNYVWSNNGTGSSITGLSAHYYTITVTDVNGCSATTGAGISEIGTAITVSATLAQPACYNSKGNISVHPSGGTGSTYAFLWSNGSVVGNLTGLQPGNYQVTVTGANSCSATRSFSLVRPDSINLQFKVSGLKCDSAIGGSVTQTSITGANYPWTASWTGPGGFTSNSVSINRLSSGKYTLRLTDALGCTASADYNVDSAGAINVNYQVTNPHCNVGNGSILYQSLTPYSSLATYNWAGSNGLISGSKNISNLGAGSYAVTVSENYGCRVIKNFTLNSSFDIGVAAIKYINIPSPAVPVIIHPIAGDMSQLNGQQCAAGISGQVQMIFSGQVSYQGVTRGGLVPAKVSGDTLTWNISNFGTLNIDSSFFVVLMTDSDASPGNQVCIQVSVTPTTGDYNPANNSSSMCLMTVRSFDPNEKRVYPEGGIDATQKLLTYTVMFQNTGTGPARNIYILDTLDANLDPATFNVTASSYPVQSYVSGNAVKFNFSGINLPDAAAGLNLSRGWVQYTIAIRNNISMGAEINNTAYIFFDFNNPVVTNTTVNNFEPKNSTVINEILEAGSVFALFPNPVHNAVHVIVDKDAVGGRLEIIDALGRKCLSREILNTQFDLVLTGLSQALYLVNVVYGTGKIQTAKLIVE